VKKIGEVSPLSKWRAWPALIDEHFGGPQHTACMSRIITGLRDGD